MNKTALIEQIIAALTAELEGYARSARSAQAEATDEQSKAENKYDTRGLEASYLARGQSRQAADVGLAIQQFQRLAAPPFSPKAPIDLGALVEMEHLGERTLYFLGPCAGGTEVTAEEKTVVVITPQSPLGQQIMAKTAGARVTLPGGKRGESWRIVAVS